MIGIRHAILVIFALQTGLSAAVADEVQGAVELRGSMETSPEAGATAVSGSAAPAPGGPSDKGGGKESNTVESFFQLTPRSLPQVPGSRPLADKPPGKQGTVGGALFHVLDWAGVPMFFHSENDLDPSLAKSYVLPYVSPASGVQAASKKDAAIQEPAADSARTQQKIPESELEGVELPAPK